MIPESKVNLWIKQGKEITFSILPSKAKLQDSKVTLQPFKDLDGKPARRSWYERVSREQEESGKYFPTSTSSITIKNGFTIDLSDEDAQKDFRWAACAPEIVESIKAGKGKKRAQFYVEMPEEEAQEELTIYRQKLKAAGYIEECTASMLKNVAMLLGLNTSVSESILRNDLMKLAMNDTYNSQGYKGYQRIVAAFEDDLQRAKIMVHRGLESGIFKREDGHYWYTPEGEEAKRIGFNIDEASEWLSLEKNSVFFRAISEALDPEYSPKKSTRKPGRPKTS